VPVYEYRCLDCAHQYEKREGFDAPALQECPSCGGTSRRLIHAAPIVFKGSGFYVTDNRKSDRREAPKSAPEAEKAAASEPKASSLSGPDGGSPKTSEPAAAS
jgi:putative FmdB family regulatory protein